MGKALGLILTIAFSFAGPAWSESESELESTPELEAETAIAATPAATDHELQADRFKSLDKSWLVEAVTELPFYSFYLGAPAVRGVAYLPNFAPRLGPRLVYRDLGMTLTFSLPIPRAEMVRRGDSKQRSIIVNGYWRSFAYDVYYQSYKGFYAANPFTELSLNKPSRYPQMPDAQVLNYGFNFYFVFNPESYSLKAAFDHKELQLRSGGSWMLTPFYNHLEMFLGGKFVPGSDPNAIPKLPNLASGRFDSGGVAGGYGYTYVRRSFFLSGQGAYGPGFQVQRIQRSDGHHVNATSLAAKLNVNVSGGWNYPDFVVGGKVLVDSTWARVLDTQMSSSLVSVQLFAGRRF